MGELNINTVEDPRFNWLPAYYSHTDGSLDRRLFDETLNISNEGTAGISNELEIILE